MTHRHAPRHRGGPNRNRFGRPTSIGRCLATGKQMYPTRKEARAAMRVVARRYGDDNLNAFKCAACGAHHFGHLLDMDRDEHRRVQAAKYGTPQEGTAP